MRRKISRVLVVCAALLAVQVSAADTAAPGGDLLASGTSAFKAHRFAEAVDFGARAIAAGAGPDALELVAIAVLMGGQTPLAYSSYERLAAMDTAPDGARNRARNQVAALKKQGGFLDLQIEPTGAQIKVDGNVVGVTPLASPLLVLAGDRRISASADEVTLRPNSGPASNKVAAATRTHIAWLYSFRRSPRSHSTRRKRSGSLQCMEGWSRRALQATSMSTTSSWRPTIRPREEL